VKSSIHPTPKSRPGLLIAAAYLLVAVAAIGLVFVVDDGLAGVFAVMIIQPWGSVLVWIMDTFGIDSFVFNVLFMLAGAAVNGWLIYRIISWASVLFIR
jgi:hypothetical protein